MGFLPAGKRAAITGAGCGIGRSLAMALARAGARSILALDQDLDGARHTAELINTAAPSCTVEAEHCDASDRNSLVSALTAHRTASGELRRPIDLFCANAGALVTGDCKTASKSDWQFAWNLNVMQIVWGAQVLVPAMAERGRGGALLVTASAAGLLTQLGSAPYTATKHAVVGLAEWLAITHAQQGVQVCCVCPQAVDTQMVASIVDDKDNPLRAAALDGLLQVTCDYPSDANPQLHRRVIM